MKRLVFAALLGLSAWLVPSAEGQVIFGPMTGPTIARPFGGQAGTYPYGYGYPYGGGPFTQTPLPTQLGLGTTPYNVVPTVVAPGATADANLGSPNDTGHPTRFASYSQYFANQGGGAVTASSTTPVARIGTAAVTPGFLGGRSTTAPSRTGSSTTPPSR